MKLLLIGDTHAAWHRLHDGIQQAYKEHGIIAAIQVGDFGFFKQYAQTVFGSASRFRFPVPLHVIDGNHEDHKWLRKCLDEGLTERWARERNIIFQQRGSIAHFGQVVVGFCGGALHADRPQEGSIDRETTNWVTNREADKAAERFTEAKVQLLVSHSCPHSIGVGMTGSAYLAESVERYISRKGYDPGPITDCGEPGLMRLWARLRHRPKEWVFGHFHTHRIAEVQGVRFRCIGAIDGSDGRQTSIMYILDSKGWNWSEIHLRSTGSHS